MGNFVEKSDDNSYLTTEQTNQILNFIQRAYGKTTAIENNIRREFYNNIIITKNEILKLHSMITTVRDKYDSKIIHNDNMTIFTSSGKQVTHRSMEEFKTLNYEDHDLTTRIRIEYNFLLSPKSNLTEIQGVKQTIDNLEKYKVTIILHSRLGLSHTENLNTINNSETKIGRFLFFNKSISAQIKIEFVDRVVGDQILDVFIKWINSCRQNTDGYLMAQCKKHSNTIVRILDIFIILSFIYFIVHKVNNINTLSNLDLMKYSIYTFLGFYIFNMSYRPLLGRLEFFLDTLVLPTYIEISDYDKNTIESILKRSKLLKRRLCQVISALILPVLTGIIVDYLGNLIK